MPPRPRTVMIKRASPKGYRLINEADFDPAVHQLYAPQDEAEPAEVPRRRGRPRKQQPELTQSQES